VMGQDGGGMHLQGAPTILRAYVCACQCTWQWHIQARPTDNGGRNVGSDSSVIAYNNHKPPTIYCSPSCQRSHIGHSRGQQVFGPPPPPAFKTIQGSMLAWTILSVGFVCGSFCAFHLRSSGYAPPCAWRTCSSCVPSSPCVYPTPCTTTTPPRAASTSRAAWC
jgi:hypothetical protein